MGKAVDIDTSKSQSDPIRSWIRFNLIFHTDREVGTWSPASPQLVIHMVKVDVQTRTFNLFLSGFVFICL